LGCFLLLFSATGTRVLGDRSFSGRGTSLSAAAENFDGDAPILQVFSFESIKAATNNFSRENQLGEGGFGPVYKVLYGSPSVFLNGSLTFGTIHVQIFRFVYRK